MEAAEESKKTIKGYIPHLRELEELDYAELSVLKLKFIQLNLKGSNEMLEEIAELLVNKRDEVKVPTKHDNPVGKCFCGLFYDGQKDYIIALQITSPSTRDKGIFKANYVVFRRNTLSLDSLKYDTTINKGIWDNGVFKLFGYTLAEIPEEKFIRIFVSMKTVHETLRKLELLQ